MKYVIELTIKSGNDEFWEEIENESRSQGCEEILDSVKRCLDLESWMMSGNCQVKLKSFDFNS